MRVHREVNTPNNNTYVPIITYIVNKLHFQARLFCSSQAPSAPWSTCFVKVCIFNNRETLSETVSPFIFLACPVPVQSSVFFSFRIVLVKRKRTKNAEACRQSQTSRGKRQEASALNPLHTTPSIKILSPSLLCMITHIARSFELNDDFVLFALLTFQTNPHFAIQLFPSLGTVYFSIFFSFF